VLDLLAEPLNQGVHAADGDEGLILPHAAEQRFTAETIPGLARST
jgi:hypothetical protein